MAEGWQKILYVQNELEAYLEFSVLAKKFTQLSVCLQQLRCGSMLEAPAFDNLRKDCDRLFHRSSVLASDSYFLIKSFEKNCVQIVDVTKVIVRLVDKGSIRMASTKFSSIQSKAKEMEEKSREMTDRFSSFSEDILAAVNTCHSKLHAASENKEHLCNRLENLSSQYKKDQKKLKELQSWLTVYRGKMPEAPIQGTTLSKNLSSIVEFGVVNVFSIKCERPDFKEKWDEYKKLTQLFEEKEAAKQQTLEALSEHEVVTKKTRKRIGHLEMVINALENGVHIMNCLSATMIKVCCFWKSMKECASDAIQITSGTKAELKNVENEEDLAEVKLSVDKFAGLWKDFGGICSYAKSQLEKSKDDLLTAMAKKISRTEAESYLQALAN